ncbi:MAG TPA: hypothetical protein VFD59_13425 [Nocardioidaceae bacterium]|nr:hypothetical protein [Nocardioidaceae bacterium]
MDTTHNQPGAYHICIDAWEVEDAVFWLTQITAWLRAGDPELAAQFTRFLRITEDDMTTVDVLRSNTTTLRQILATATQHEGHTP